MRLDEEIYNMMSPYQGLICHEEGHLCFHACVAEISPLLDIKRFDQRTSGALLYLDDGEMTVMDDVNSEWPNRRASADRLRTNLPKNISQGSLAPPPLRSCPCPFAP
jgi:hypothetical protein